MRSRLSLLEAALNKSVSRTLWTIDKPDQSCVEPARLKVLGRELKVTPTIRCHIVGHVTRGPIRLTGKGDRLYIAMPVKAEISARDVGGVIKSETATGAATVHAVARLSVDRHWSPVTKVDIAYDWTEPPGIDFLGQRVRFVEKADARLAGVIAGLERDIPRHLSHSSAVRQQVSDLWRSGFRTFMLNRENPPVWMRATPRTLGFGGYHVAGDHVDLIVSAEALTETFVGGRPKDPAPTPLPPPVHARATPGLRFSIPVLAEFRQLEPVVERALAKRAAQGITLPNVGPVDAGFGKVTIYATEGGKLAVGIEATAKARGSALGAGIGTTRGKVWLTATPYNDPGSQRVAVRDLAIAGETDSRAVNLLLSLFDDPATIESIRLALSHDFATDYDAVVGKARKAIASRREGDFLIETEIKAVRNGAILVTGQGLYMPVDVQGSGRISYQPRKRGR